MSAFLDSRHHTPLVYDRSMSLKIRLRFAPQWLDSPKVWCGRQDGSEEHDTPEERTASKGQAEGATW